jgi:hypothetical protein
MAETMIKARAHKQAADQYISRLLTRVLAASESQCRLFRFSLYFKVSLAAVEYC